MGAVAKKKKKNQGKVPNCFSYEFECLSSDFFIITL